MMKCYPIESSPLFKLENKRRLAQLLRLERKAMTALLARADDNYTVGSVPKPDGTMRDTETPKADLKHVQKRLLRLLSRIQYPAYLHSGVKGRSYRTNATEHAGNGAVAKIDMKKFFPSTTFEHVKRGFRNAFQCSPDIAYVIARLCTYGGHVPTGSPISCLIAYYAHKQLFDALFVICTRKGWKLTCYVDDLTISGPGVNRKSLVSIRRAAIPSGLILHKEAVYAKDAAKLITGNIVQGASVKLPNRRRRAIYDGLSILRSEHLGDTLQLDRELRSLKGRINEAALVDTSFRNRRDWLLKMVSDIECRVAQPNACPVSSLNTARAA